MEIHIGSLIRRRLDEKGYSVVWLARQLACSRTNVYKIFEKPHIDTDMLARISTVLDYDFSFFCQNLSAAKRPMQRSEAKTI